MADNSDTAKYTFRTNVMRDTAGGRRCVKVLASYRKRKKRWYRRPGSWYYVILEGVGVDPLVVADVPEEYLSRVGANDSVPVFDIGPLGDT
ncbi:hypothetical protein HYFRA_00005868 [Hymenoscyphus fraxineus]|uniref:Uncharacterized protein n=1 Tax=Hymenoscyphus fraxineus TaxID=746836 RepID=A0A9N9PT85_9HELO|nr:hypothetical protein HYFRA_00005868 [Hymenoscyphus fraxineus]